jgi:glutamine synthetase
MTHQEIINYVNNHPSGKVKLAIADIDGVLRGKYISKQKFLSLLDGDLGFCDVIFGWDMADVCYDNGTFTGWHSGYPDAKAKLDLNTFRKIPWENDIPFFLAEFIESAAEICPRNVLKRVIEEAVKQGFKPFFSQEFEWFNFEETPASIHEKGFQNLSPLTPGMFGYSLLRSSLRNDFMTNIFEQLTKFDIPLEGLHTETGPGVYEAAITYSDILLAADRAILFKNSVKEIANNLGIMATFMAKFSENLPGCSGHVHQSLWDAEEKTNLFYDQNTPNNISPLMENYMAGQLHCLPHILPMVAPTINSYKRLVEGAWAPTTLTWAVDNRTVALRALPLGKKSCRLETRVVGSDTNPYLALAACLAAGLYGIRHQLKLKQPATVGNGYRDISNGVLPGNLHEATHAMKNSDVAKELFGETFVQHFTQTRDWEWRQHAKVVTDWELKRYFEIV